MRMTLIYKLCTSATFVVFILLAAIVLAVDSKIVRGFSIAQQFWFISLLPVAGVIATVLSSRKSFHFEMNHITNLNMITMTVVITGIYLSTNTQEVMKTGTTLLVITSYFYFLALFQAKKNYTTIFHFTLIALAFIELIWGYCQLYSYLPSQNTRFSITGSFNNPGPYAAFLAITTPFCLYWTITLSRKLIALFPEKDPSGNKEIDIEIVNTLLLLFLSGSTLVGILTILPATMIRGAWIAATVGSVAVLTFTFHLEEKIKNAYKKHPKRSLTLFIGIALLISVACYGIYTLKKDSADGRLFIWKLSLSILKEHPLTGVGLGNFQTALGKAQANYFLQGDYTPRERMLADIPEHGFNEFIQIAVEGGIVGIVFFLTLLCSTFWYGLRNIQYDPHAAAPLAAFLAYGFVLLFSYPLSALALTILFILLLALCNVSYQSNTSDKKKYYFILYLFLIGINFGIIYPQFNTYDAYKKWAVTKKYYEMKVYATAIEQYDKLYSTLKIHPDFLYEYGDALTRSGNPKQGIRILSEAALGMSDPMIYNLIGKNYQSQKNFGEAERYYLKAHYLVPNRLYPLYLLANLYQEMQLPYKAIAMAQEVIEADVKINSTATKEIKFKMTQLVENIQRSSFLDGASHHQQ